MAAIDRYRKCNPQSSDAETEAIAQEITPESGITKNEEGCVTIGEAAGAPLTAKSILKKLGKSFLIGSLKFVGGILFLLVFISLFNFLKAA